MPSNIVDVTSSLDPIQEWPNFGRHYPDISTSSPSREYLLYTIFNEVVYRIHWMPIRARMIPVNSSESGIRLSLSAFEDDEWRVMWKESLTTNDAELKVTDLMERLESYVVADVL